MNLQKEKTSLLVSVIIGLVAVLTYVLVIGIQGNGLYASNVFIDFWQTWYMIELFLISSALSLTLTSILVLFTKQITKRVFISLTIGLAIVLMIGIPNLLTMRKVSLYQLTENKTLDTTQVIELYEKVVAKGDVKAISNIAVHPNLPDSLQGILSDSEVMEIRRSIAWDTDSKEMMQKLSKDNEWEVRNAVATNKFTPLKILIELQSDTNKYVRNTASSMSEQRE